MSLDHVVRGSYGQVIEITVTEDGSAKNISGYTTTRQIILQAPSGKIATLTATFKTDGSDGILHATVTQGTFDEGGEWAIQARAASESIDIYTMPSTFTVTDRLE